MTHVKAFIAACISGLAIAATAASALAKEDRLFYLSAEMNFDRERALRECNAEVAPWNNRDWQGTQIIRYNGCMFQRGQMP